jgi:hypothetical protein
MQSITKKEMRNAVRAVRGNSEIEKKLQSVQLIFIQARDRILFELKDELEDTTNFVTFVVKAMQVLKDIDIHSYERQDLVIDLVQSVVESMTIDEEEKEEIRAKCFPAIVSIVSILSASAKGYLYIQQGIDTAEQSVRGCFRKAPVSAKKIRNVKTTPLDIEATFLDIFSTISVSITHKQLSLSNIIPIGSMVMQIVEEYPQLPGSQKKEVVISVMHKLINDSNLSESTKATLNVIIDTVLAKTIDFVVSAARGEIELVNIIVEKIQSSSCCK